MRDIWAGVKYCVVPCRARVWQFPIKICVTFAQWVAPECFTSAHKISHHKYLS